MSSCYTRLSDISSDSDEDVTDTRSVAYSDTFSDIPAVVAAEYQSFEYGDFTTHPTFPLNIRDGSQPENLPKFFPQSHWSKDYILRVKFSPGYRDFSATTTILLNETDTYTLRQHVEAWDRELQRTLTSHGKIAAVRLRQSFFECGIDSASFYIGLKRALKRLTHELIPVRSIPV